MDIFRENRTQGKEKEEPGENYYLIINYLTKRKRKTEFCFGSWKTQISITKVNRMRTRGCCGKR